MDGVQTVDVSWLHHSQKDHLSRTKSATSTTSDRSPAEKDATSATSVSPRTSQTNGAPVEPPSSKESRAFPKVIDDTKSEEKIEKVDKRTEAPKLPTSNQSPTVPKSSPKPIGRRNSWISSLSSKFSSGSTPPSQSSFKGSPASPKATSPLDAHNPFGAAYFPKDRETEKKEETTTPSSTSPKGTSFIHNALRKFSSNQGGLPKLPANSAVCPRRVMNIDPGRDRCKVTDLKQGKLNRVAFCVDVEIAGISHRDSDEDAPPTNQLRQSLPESNRQKAKKSEGRENNHGASATPKSPKQVADKEALPSVSPPTTLDSETLSLAPTLSESSNAGVVADAPANGEVKDTTRKQEKKKRSEEERKERKERKRRQAVANGTIPLQLDGQDEEDDLRPSVGGLSRSKTQSHPTTDPVRIYRRCCQLRETPVLKRIVDEISSPSSTLAESPGTVAALDLSNFPMTIQDIATFSDWLAVVPVRKLILENCSLNDESVRSILSGLLSTKTVEQMRYRRRRLRQPDSPVVKNVRWGVVEKLSLKKNPRIGREGWRHISLFVHLSRSLKAIDLSGIPFPKIRAPSDSPAGQTLAPPFDACAVFAEALGKRFGGDHLEELLLSECMPSTDQVKQICTAATTMKLRRLGLANNGISREGLRHVVDYLKDEYCEGLDLGGNPIKDDLDLIVSAIEPDQPLFAISLADCSLNPSVICPLLQGLSRLHNLRFLDVSHNPELFSSQPSSLAAFRRFLPKMHSLKRIHLADVDLSPDHVIGLAEVLPECPSLCHLNIMENPQIAALASSTNPAVQEEACAVYASMMTAVRVSKTIIAVDIDVPAAESNEVVKALASQIVAYSLRNLEGGAIAEELSESINMSPTKDVPVPEILQHIVGHANGLEEINDEEVNAAPDEDYVIGGTGVVKALGVCLGNLNQDGGDNLGDASTPASGTATPRRPKSRGVATKRPRDMSKNLLESARNIRARIQTALVREDRLGNDANYRRLQFLDFTLQRMIQRFEDEYPETRILPPPAPASAAPDNVSQHSSDGLSGPSASDVMNNYLADNENAIDDEETDQYAIHLSRTSSMTSLHSRAMTSEEGHVHRLGQNLRRDFLNPPPNSGEADDEASHLLALRKKLEKLHEDRSRSPFDSPGAEDTFEKLGLTVDELWAARHHDAEAFERFKQSQIAAQINSKPQQSDNSTSTGMPPQRNGTGASTQ
ncbi:Uncharacterized protein PECH_002533 [Penicillium ucsense]|uniref:Cell wall biogenesis protein Mhp1 n=1 Tax=Penicillium ucsense TaxID=2839758 RepID=A0A8J8WFU7_9EURO|nr:Uncharacterized protein PECM_000881 [Penicillium ucsense]KAF7730788.1 Uncharacterized protein PECH_002533 [Penicillium ucsense]